MTPITIMYVTIQYPFNVTECMCNVTANTVLGSSTVQQMIMLESTSLPVDWTDTDLCNAVAAKLGVPSTDVSVAV